MGPVDAVKKECDWHAERLAETVKSGATHAAFALLVLVYLLKHAAGLGQLTHYDEDLAAIDELAVLGTKRDPLTDDELVCSHRRYLARPALLAVLRGFLGLPLPDRVETAAAFPSPAAISSRIASDSVLIRALKRYS